MFEENLLYFYKTIEEKLFFNLQHSSKDIASQLKKKKQHSYYISPVERLCYNKSVYIYEQTGNAPGV